jgi:uncharacterized protein YndB with AHSA1/START domain
MRDIKLTLPIKADSQRVFDACIDPVALTTWFAERADISIDEKRYDFWGRFTPVAPPKRQGHHEITIFEPGRNLVYNWKLRGAETSVEYDIVPDSDGCLFQLRHTGLPELKPYESSIGDFWTHVFEGLRNWLEHGRAHELMDYSRAPVSDVGVSAFISARPQDVFRSLTDPFQLNRWVAKKAKLDPKPGGEIDFGWGAGPVKILEIVPDRKISFTWRWEKEPETVTTWELEESGGGTMFTIVQSGFAPDRDSEDYYIGWHKFIWRLKTMIEAGPDWKRIQITDDEG